MVVFRLGVVQNAYFYITWMLGSIFFMVSFSISNSLFAESVRSKTALRAVVAKAFRITSILLIPVIIVMIIGGRFILDIFGRSYATAGYGLLVVIAISAIPDALCNIAFAIFRVTDRLTYSASVNIGILVVTVCSSWFLIPLLGIIGAGLAWLSAQVLGAIASSPAYMNLGKGEGMGRGLIPDQAGLRSR
jgi:O-antigen/teichoic acid export membrane protein